jgi:hypothetical protein
LPSAQSLLNSSTSFILLDWKFSGAKYLLILQPIPRDSISFFLLKNHVTMKKVVEHFQSNRLVCRSAGWSAGLPVGWTVTLMEVVPPPKNYIYHITKSHTEKTNATFSYNVFIFSLHPGMC